MFGDMFICLVEVHKLQVGGVRERAGCVYEVKTEW